jgi:Membrane magnesium transporter
MSSSKFGYGLLALSVVILIHAGYSVNHYEGLLVDRHGSSSGFSLPFDVIAEVLAALGLALFGALAAVSGSFSPIHSSGENSLNAFHKLFAPRWDFAPMRPGGVFSKEASASKATKQIASAADAQESEAERPRSQSPASRRAAR